MVDKTRLAELLMATRSNGGEVELDIKVLKGQKGDSVKGDKGDMGERGLPPKHEITDGKIRFENPDGTWGKWVDFNELVKEAVGKATEGAGFVSGGSTEASVAPEGSPGTVAWADITSKPTTISGYAISDAYTKVQTDLLLISKSDTSHNHDGSYAAISHSHAISDVTGLATALDAKADASATQTALDGKAAISHTHTASQITDFNEAVDDRVAATLVAGSNITLTYNDGANTLTVAASGGGGSDPWTYVKLGSDFTTSSGTAVDITGLLFTPAADKIYIFEGFILNRSDTATIGPRVGVTWPTGLTDSGIEIIAAASATTSVQAYGNDATERTNLNTGVVNTTSSWPVRIAGMIISGGSPSGNVQFRLNAETAGTNVTVRAGSFIRYREI